MIKKQTAYVIVFAMAITAILFFQDNAQAKRMATGGRGDGPVVYVTGQGLFYDSIVTADPLPPNGPFQQLEMTGPTGLQTEFGPGDTGYVGGRWWIDLNGDSVMNEKDKYFLCPLLGPGRVEMW